jgi:hypothetical protein
MQEKRSKSPPSRKKREKGGAPGLLHPPLTQA